MGTTPFREPDPERRREINDAIVYGWDGGTARAFAALRPYVRHLDACEIDGGGNPQDDRCTCGLRLAWRIRETPE